MWLKDSIWLALMIVTVPLAKADHIQWLTDQAQGTGAGCKFAGDPSGEVNAWMLANGDDLAVVFTELGASTKTGATGKRITSTCSFSVPVEVPSGYYLESWDQELQYGIVKPVGIMAGMQADFNLLGQSGRSKNLTLPMPLFHIMFPHYQDLNIPLAIAKSPHANFFSQLPRLWLSRWCDKDRATRMLYRGKINMWSQKVLNNDLQVIFAVDGLDARFEFSATIAKCQ